MKEKKLIKFVHKDIINAINGQLPRKLKEMLEEENGHVKSVSINELQAPYITGAKNNEKIISEYEIELNGRKQTLTYFESVVSAEMTIKIGNKIIGVIENMERLSEEIIDTLFRTVRKDLISGK